MLIHIDLKGVSLTNKLLETYSVQLTIIKVVITLNHSLYPLKSESSLKALKLKINSQIKNGYEIKDNIKFKSLNFMGESSCKFIAAKFGTRK